MSTIDWNDRVAAALDHLSKPGRILKPSEFLTIIDDVVRGDRTASELAAAHTSHDLVATALGHVTTGLQGGGSVKPLGSGGWYEPAASHNAPYKVDPDFAAAWKKARGLP